MTEQPKIYVAGHRGMVGSSIVPVKSVSNSKLLSAGGANLQYVLTVLFIGLVVTLLVEGATKIEQLPDRSMDVEQADAETLRKMFSIWRDAGLVYYGGLAGALYAHQATYMDSTTFNIMLSVEVLMFVVVGGGTMGADVATVLARGGCRVSVVEPQAPTRQALAQREARSLTVEDGWLYFVHGWTQVVAQVLHFDLTPDLFARLEQAAANSR